MIVKETKQLQLSCCTLYVLLATITVSIMWVSVMLLTKKSSAVFISSFHGYQTQVTLMNFQADLQKANTEKLHHLCQGQRLFKNFICSIQYAAFWLIW